MRPVAVLVEGESDAEAVRALAERRGAALDVVAMSGITNLARHARELAPTRRLVGLYDAAEERFVRGGLERAGLVVGSDLAAHGFHRCEADLEDELIRALGAERVLAVVDAQGDRARFEALRQQPAQRERTTEAQLHRWLGAGSGRKIRYGRLLVEALDGRDVPAPLAALLDDALVGRSPA